MLYIQPLHTILKPECYIHNLSILFLNQNVIYTAFNHNAKNIKHNKVTLSHDTLYHIYIVFMEGSMLQKKQMRSRVRRKVPVSSDHVITMRWYVRH